MSEVKLELYWNAVDADSPSGDNLEYDARFVELTRVAEGTREQQYGDTIVAAQPPDWRAVRQLAVGLAGQTRDLRIAVLLIESMTHDHGLDGLCESILLLQHWVCDHWETIHPQLDADDGCDPFVRINCLGRLCEADRLPRLIGKMPLVEALPHTTVTFNDLRNQENAVPVTAKPDRPTTMEIEAAFLSMPLATLRERYQVCQRAESSLQETVRFLERQAGPGVWDARPLLDQLHHCTEAIKQQLKLRLAACDSVVADVTAVTPIGVTGDPVSDRWSHDQVDQSISSLSRIRVESRDDASQVIEAATKYFERHEPSSPVPLLLRRAKRLINQGFVDILRDLAPDALANAQYLAGDPDD